MSDPLGLIGSASNSGQVPGQGIQRQQDGSSGADFKKMLIGNLQEVNAVQQDATQATEDLLAGRRNDVEDVILATQKADTAFKMLQAMRNQVMQAMDEVKQMRV
jgi:flagellar hook-basal body complex protein FliE